MKKPNRYNPLLKYATHLFCAIIGVTFILSGFTKAVDPWGTAIKFEEYFLVYGFDFLLPLSRILAIWLCGAEMMMGCMIFCRVRLRLISIFALVSMSIFTLVTILSVTFFPVEECGCFGDALYLTPWQTLIKNLIILPMVFVIWWRYRPDKILVYKPREVVLGTLFCVVCMGFSTYNYFNLPMIDYLPYKVGVDLLAEVESTTSDVQYSVVLVYRNITSGEIREFSVDDTQWHDDTQWEWVDTRTKVSGSTIKLSAGDIAINSIEGENVTVELLSAPGKLNMLAITDIKALRQRCLARIEEYVALAATAGDHTIIVTPSSLDNSYAIIGGESIQCFNLDITTFHGIMRSSVGVIELSDGVIVDKRSCINL
ncbi:MAG: BT_3928 family protein [Rikenellaceae bacterium]